MSISEGRVDAEALHPISRGEAQFGYREVHARASRQGLAEELDDRDAGDHLRVVEREEHASLGPLVDRPLRDVVALELDRAAGDLVLVGSHQGCAER